MFDRDQPSTTLKEKNFPTPLALIREGVSTVVLNYLCAALLLATVTGMGVAVPSSLAPATRGAAPSPIAVKQVMFHADPPDCGQGGCGRRWSPLSGPLARLGGQYLNVLPGRGSLTLECVSAPDYLPVQRITIDRVARGLLVQALRAGRYDASYGYVPRVIGRLVSLVVGLKAGMEWERPGLKLAVRGDRMRVEMATVLNGPVRFDLDPLATEKLLGAVMEGTEE